MTANLEFLSPMFVPANRPEIFNKAALSEADAIIFDLEDAVPPQEKDTARANLPVSFDRLPALVRVNAMGTRWFGADVERCLQLPIAGLVVPKVRNPADLEPLCRRLAARSVPVIALIESARGMANARSIAAVGNIGCLAFGSIDYCADVGCAHAREALLSARNELVLASRLSNISPPLDGITAKVDDPNLVYEDARHSVMLGFGGKLCIHPSQVRPIKAGFRPDAVEVEWARTVLSANGDGATAVNGAMVDEPVRISARRILERDHRCT